jgi:DNA-binding MarR family transcriptional regulator
VTILTENNFSEHGNLSEEFVRATARFHRLSMKKTWIVLSKGRFIVLHIIYQATLTEEQPQSVSVSAIAERMQISLPSLSRMLRTLERQGLIERFPDPVDRRNTLVNLTEDGQQLHQHAAAIASEYIDLMTDELGADHLRLLIKELNDCSDVMGHVLEIMRERHPELRDIKCPLDENDGDRRTRRHRRE